MNLTLSCLLALPLAASTLAPRSADDPGAAWIKANAIRFITPEAGSGFADLEKLAADDNADTPALHGWRREAFGEDALKLKRGELALVLDGARVKVAPVRRAQRPEQT